MSLGMSFARRRMMAAKKEPKYVWAVYDFAYVRDEEKATTGSFSATRTRTKMAASAYTANEGGFTLTDAVSTSLQNLQVGQFIVDIGTTSNSTATSGAYLYEVTGKSGSYTTTVQYKRYNVKAARGENELYRVESDTADYPVDGEQDGLWYVMVKGELLVCVWDVYNVVYGLGSSSTGQSIVYDSNLTCMTATKYTVGSSGFTLINPTNTDAGFIKSGMYAVHRFNGLSAVSSTATSGSYLYRYTSDAVRNSNGGYYYANYVRYEVSSEKDSAVLNQVESVSENAYPQDGEYNGFWYTYSHSYLYEFDNR